MPAANQEVYYGEKIVISDNMEYSDYTYVVVGILGYLRYAADSGVTYYSNCYEKGNSAMFTINESKGLKSVAPIDGAVNVGDSYGIVIRKILSSISSLWSALWDSDNTYRLLLDMSLPIPEGSSYINRIRIFMEGRNLFFRAQIERFEHAFSVQSKSATIAVVSVDSLTGIIPSGFFVTCFNPEVWLYSSESVTHQLSNTRAMLNAEFYTLNGVLTMRVNVAFPDRYGVDRETGSLVDLWGKTVSIAVGSSLYGSVFHCRVPSAFSWG